MMTLRCCLLLLLSPLAACTAMPTVAETGPLFSDTLFKPLAAPIDTGSVFAMTPEMLRYADTELAPAMRHGSAERELVEALYDRGRLQLEYDADQTRTAASAFAARTGNCLSLVIMTGAFAKHFGLPVQYQQVMTKETWSRTGNIALANGHVNLRLARDNTTGTRISYGEGSQADALTVDFLPSAAAQRYRVRSINEDTVVAMYMNNRAAELLSENQPDEAYWWARQGIKQVPTFTNTYNTLGVIYLQHGNLAEAERVLNHALALEPENTLAMSNLVAVLKGRGRDHESQQLATRLASIEPFPPYHFFDLGIAALKAGKFEDARTLFQREIKREAYEPDAHFWLAIANIYLGEPRKAERHIKLAIANSTTIKSRAIYSSKLDWLKAQGYEQKRRGPARAS